MPYLDFTEMPVWQKADEVIGDIYKLTEGLPKKEDYAFVVRSAGRLSASRQILQRVLEEITSRIR